MKSLAIIIGILLLSGCAAHRTEWRPTGITKTNFYEAHNDCTLKDRAYMSGTEPGFGYTMQWNRFMEECMAGQGYGVVRDH